MSTNKQWIKTARAGGVVQRLHTRPTIQGYSNAEHSHGAAIIAAELCRVNSMSNVSANVCIRYMLVHDIAECYTGDSPANVKKEHPHLKQSLDKIEAVWCNNNVPAGMMNELNDLERGVCKCADLIELGLFCATELAMGNRTISDVFGRVVQYLQEPQLRHVAGVDDLIQLMKEVKNG